MTSRQAAPWRVPTRYGAGAVDRVPELVARLGGRRVMLVCGGRSFEASGAARILPELERVAAVRRWSGFAPNPDAADLWHGLEVAADFGPDVVLGVGGGSALDMAKLLSAFGGGAAGPRARADGGVADGPGRVADAAGGVADEAGLHAAIRSGDRIVHRATRLVLVPTTAGSGSEATHFAVVYLGEEKFSVAGPALRPDAVVLDPALTTSGSGYQRASSGIDAVAQAIESLWAVGATAASRRWARHALRLLLPAIEPFVHAPDDRSARAMVVGSHLAGRAIDISKTTGAHALSYAITKRYGLSHGHAVALTLGAFIEAHDDPDPRRLRVDRGAHAQAMAEIRRRLGAPDGPAARAAFEALVRRLGLDLSLSAVGARGPAARAALAAAVNPERLSNNPVAFTAGELAAMLPAT